MPEKTHDIPEQETETSLTELAKEIKAKVADLNESLGDAAKRGLIVRLDLGDLTALSLKAKRYYIHDEYFIAL